jgi:isocitrate/isopropylmalate dehydrogenase
MLLRHVAERAAADAVEAAVFRVLEERRTVTADLGGTASTMEMAGAIADAVGRA